MIRDPDLAAALPGWVAAGVMFFAGFTAYSVIRAVADDLNKKKGQKKYEQEEQPGP